MNWVVRYVVEGHGEQVAGPWDLEEATRQRNDIRGYEGVSNVRLDLQMIRVVFLDIDGVLNGQHMADKLDAQHKKLGCANRYADRESGSCRCYALENQIDRAAVGRLNALLGQTGAKVVVSSSWRKLVEASEIERVLAEHGFIGEIIGQTPDLPNDERWKKSWRGTMWTDKIERGHEIWEWMRTRPDVEAFVILDDCKDMWRLKSCLVQTSDQTGLDEQDVAVAQQLMNRSGRVLAALREEYK